MIDWWLIINAYATNDTSPDPFGVKLAPNDFVFVSFNDDAIYAFVSIFTCHQCYLVMELLCHWAAYFLMSLSLSLLTNTTDTVKLFGFNIRGTEFTFIENIVTVCGHFLPQICGHLHLQTSPVSLSLLWLIVS